MLPIGEYKPDVADYQSQATRSLLNVQPRGDGYGPFKSLTAYTSALPGVCRGGYYALNPDGSITTFAATATRIYRLDPTDYTWEDVSKSGSAYSALSSSAQWQFRQFNNFVIAVQQNIAPQVFDITSDTEFSNLGGSPPQAAYVEIVGRFVVLSGLLSNPFRIQWSGLNAPSTWDGTNSSDFQDFSDGGIVRGVAGGESGVIFQDGAIRRMSYVPGSPLIFQIDRIAQDKGLAAPYSIIRAGEHIFFYGTKGFEKIEPGGIPTQIGRERTDRTFLSDLVAGNLQLFTGTADPRGSKVYWTYKSVAAGADAVFDKMLGYDYVLDRFFPISLTGEYLLGISQSGVSLESLDAISTSLDALTLPFDAYAASVQPELAAFGSDHALGFFRGDNLEATLESGEQGADGQRIRVRGFRPITDSQTVSGSIRYRETVGDTPTDGVTVSRNARTGRCDLLRSTRLVRYRCNIPAGTNWSFFAGIEPDVVSDGAQ